MTRLYTEEDVKRKLLRQVKERNNGCVPKEYQALLEKMFMLAETNNPAETARVLLEFSKAKKTEKLVRITSAEIPADIAVFGAPASIHNIKVNGYGPDDEIYSKNPDLRQKIPRGFAILETQDGALLDVVIYANKKFTGSAGDEDEDAHQPNKMESWKEYFISDYDNATKVISTEKINGEAAHFSARYIDGQFCIITGSKNVHLLMRKKEDIELYEGDRFNIAKVIARVVWETLEGLTPDNRNLVLSLLHHTRCTAVCEVLQPDHQHIVNLSHLNKPQIYVLSLTPAASSGDQDNSSSLLVLPPNHMLDLFTGLGFTCPTYKEVSIHKASEHKDSIRSELHTEGKVLYFVNKKGETIGLVKAKSGWYVLMRSLREKAVYSFTTAKKHKDWTIDHQIKSMSDRFDNIEEWLQCSDTYITAWKELGAGFLQWLEEELKEQSEAEKTIRPRYPLLWAKYLSDTNKLGGIGGLLTHWTQSVGHDCDVHTEDKVDTGNSKVRQWVVGSNYDEKGKHQKQSPVACESQQV
ncbi:hypothetical protein Pmani_020991 [Petrolisthes manimaculis]|uniref:DUF7920 domain-containing protein n=1 Tax=Petrolisthes manimaculis TaxID=1843537 RepID=A0AAE1PHL1_9EUCA|nr:hypothetical protein Pmani_020991 [Petrolisthes manimaculis]